MKVNKRIKPTESELRILQLLWTYGPSTVKLVNEKLNEVKTTGYTTTLKLMQIMTQKKLLTRVAAGRQHIYKPLLPQKKAQKDLLTNLAEAAFQGSAAKLVMQALGNSKTSKEELAEIKELINKIERNK